MRVIIDTNVLISGIFFKGPPYTILNAWRKGQVQIVVSPEIFLEYERVANILSYKYSNIDIHPILELITSNAEFISPKHIKSQITNDPDDEKFIECAITGEVSKIISGDKHLLEVTGYEGISILKPAEFATKYLDDEA